jgi:hypothetical protein
LAAAGTHAGSAAGGVNVDRFHLHISPRDLFSFLFFFNTQFSCTRKNFWHTARTVSERAALPNLDTLNHEALKALIVAQHAQILSRDEQLLHKEEQLASRDEEIERLKLLIAKLRRMQFGRKSEKLERQIEQLELRLDELEAARAEKAAAGALLRWPHRL